MGRVLKTGVGRSGLDGQYTDTKKISRINRSCIRSAHCNIWDARLFSSSNNSQAVPAFGFCGSLLNLFRFFATDSWREIIQGTKAVAVITRSGTRHLPLRTFRIYAPIRNGFNGAWWDFVCMCGMVPHFPVLSHGLYSSVCVPPLAQSSGTAWKSREVAVLGFPS